MASRDLVPLCASLCGSGWDHYFMMQHILGDAPSASGCRPNNVKLYVDVASTQHEFQQPNIRPGTCVGGGGVSWLLVSFPQQ